MRDRIEALVQQGNRNYARLLIQEGLGGEQAPDLWILIQQLRAKDHQILAPIIHNSGDLTRSLTCALQIDPGNNKLLPMEQDTRDSIQAAFDDAWLRVGGPGKRPSLSLGVRLAELEGFIVSGGSLYLGALLAAVGYWGDAKPIQNVLATGKFDCPIDYLDAKLGLAEATREDLKFSTMLLASSGVVPNDPQQKFTLVEDAGIAIDHTFELRPWHPNADVRYVHIHCGSSRKTPPQRFEGQNVRLIQLPDSLKPDDILESVRLVREALEGCARAELSIAGPTTLAFALGAELKNIQPAVRIIDSQSNKPWWHNKARSLPEQDIEAVSEPEPYVAICRPDGAAPDGWSKHTRPTSFIARAQVRSELARFWAKYKKAKTLHLGLGVPVAFAWAMGTLLRGQVHTVVYAYVQGDYKPWFELGPAGLVII